MKALHKALTIAALLATIAYLGTWPSPPILHAQVGGPWRLTSTTLAAAQTATATTVRLTTSTGVSLSAGNIAPPSASQGAFIVWVDGEAERVTAAAGTNIWTVQRGWGGTGGTSAHANARPVWFGLEGQFQSSDPPIGTCTSPIFVVPWINLTNAQVWLCVSSLWQATSHRNIVFNSDPGQTSLSP